MIDLWFIPLRISFFYDVISYDRCETMRKSCQIIVIINFFAILITVSYGGNFGLIDQNQGIPIMKISMVSYSDILRLFS